MNRIFVMFLLFGLLFGHHQSALATSLSQGGRAKCLQMLVDNYGMATSQTELKGNLADIDSMFPGCLEIVSANAPRTDDILQMCSDIASKKADVERAMGRLLPVPSAPVCVARQQEQAKVDSEREQTVSAWKENALNKYRMHGFDCPSRSGETPRSAKLCAVSRIRLAYVRYLISRNDSEEEDWSAKTFTGGETATDTAEARPYESCPSFQAHAYEVVVASVTTNDGVISDDPNDTHFMTTSGYQDLDRAALARARMCRFRGRFSNASFTMDLPFSLEK